MLEVEDVEWYQGYLNTFDRPMDEVVTEDSLIFHNPNELESTIDMETMDIEKAISKDISPCSKCFKDMSSYKEVFLTRMR